MMALEGKAVIVTGAGLGLGRAYAVQAAAHGASVVVNDIDRETVATVVAEIESADGRAVGCNLSVADWDEAARIVRLCKDEFGSVDGLVNNAGIFEPVKPWAQEPEAARRMIDVNVFGTIAVGTHALVEMIDQGSGSIVNTTSVAQMGLSSTAVYSATKGAVSSLTYSWAIDLVGHGIRVNAISPSASTRQTDNSPNPIIPPPPRPVDNAPAVIYLLSDFSAGVTGQVIQRRGDKFIVDSHPQMTAVEVARDTWSLKEFVEHFDPVLRDGIQPVGYPPGAYTMSIRSI
jgi:NAD(P)-dependent dehydrogenase (short-subunit alcohol dehydrogenase family)